MNQNKQANKQKWFKVTWKSMTNIGMANISAYLLSVIFFINNIVLSISLHIHDNRNTVHFPAKQSQLPY